MDKFMALNASSIPSTVVEVMVGRNATGKQVGFFPEHYGSSKAREYWVDFQRFGTVKRTGTLEEFFRQRKEQGS